MNHPRFSGRASSRGTMGRSACNSKSSVKGPRPYHEMRWNVAFVSSLRLDTAGNRRFSGAREVPGADVWSGSETSWGLDPDGCMVRRPHGRHCAQENRDASGATSRGGCARRNATEKSCQRWCKGKVWPLDRYYEGSGGYLSGTICVSHTLEEEMDHGEPSDPSGSGFGSGLH